jgi:hypothetical protein
MAHNKRKGFKFSKADNPNDVRVYALLRYGEKSYFTTMDEVRAELERV